MHIKDLTYDIVQSYAEACRLLYYYISVLQKDGYNLVVVPSRGAHPFLDGAHYYDYHLNSTAWPRPDFSIRPIQRIKTLYLPFTADPESSIAIPTQNIRRYWARTLAAIIRRDKLDVAYRLHEFLRGQAGNLAIGGTTVNDDCTDKFVFIDTVVSGQAISEILAAFEENRLSNCHFLLLLDEEGARLKSEYKQRIDRMNMEGRATIIPLSKIFTEDEGPSMSGIWTVTFPDLMQKAREMVPDLADTGEVAAGLYYFEVSRRPDNTNLNFTISNSILMSLISSAVAEREGTTKRFLEEFQAHITKGNLQNQEKTKAVATPRIMENLKDVKLIEVSSSHVIRAYLGAERAEAKIKAFLRL